MTAKEIRESFIDFFKSKQHTVVRSSPIVPLDDPTLLFTNAGMNQFKDIFLAKGTRDYTRAVNSQKCIRVSGKHNDLEEVGHDTYHHTFFEMLGNWSFGDYYKEEAIVWAWELLTKVWKLPKDKLYATVYRDDDEAANLWTKVTDIKKDHVLRFDEKDNFWEMGETGPCGPCSEIHMDLGPSHCDKPDVDHECAVNGSCGRFIELWNLVFIQYNRDETGKLSPLPSKHVDTGAGFERLVAVLQKKKSNYDTDLFTPILKHIGEIVGIPYDQSDEQMAYRVIADHVRMLTISIADGGFPSNEGRGYVMRRILRRASRYGRKLNMNEPFIYKIVDTVVNILGDTFDEISERADHVKKVIQSEEIHFNRTLDRGLEIFEGIKEKLENQAIREIPGEYVFILYDTYGFPVDLTRILALEAGLKIDSEGFENEMKIQRERARKAAKFTSEEIESGKWIKLVINEPGSNFVGYTEDAIETHMVKYSIINNNLNIVLKDTPFYAESGGQTGDKGTLVINGFSIDVTNTIKEGDDIIHVCDLPEEFELKTDKVIAEINPGFRRQTEKNHTATHLLHAALRKVLGAHVQQAGSLVAPDRLRFDFTQYEKLSEDQLLQIEQIVNEKIQEDLPLVTAQESFTQAKKLGAMALFGEKYGEIVRMIKIDNFSLELCGGTHVDQTGQIGLFIVVSESSIASGIRRVEAITGTEAVKYLQQIKSLVKKLSELLNSQETEILSKIKELIKDKKKIEKELSKLSSQSLVSDLERIIENKENINGIDVVSFALQEIEMDQLKELGDKVREKTKNTVALLGSKSKGKLSFVCVVTDDLLKDKKYDAGSLVREVAKIAGGGGGGKPHMATAGGKDENKFDEAMAKIKELI